MVWYKGLHLYRHDHRLYKAYDQYQAGDLLWYEDTCCVLSPWTSSLVRRPLAVSYTHLTLPTICSV